MSFHPWTFLFEVLNFLVLAYVLYRLLYKPLHDAIDSRRAAAAAARAEAEQAHKEARDLEQKLRAEQAAQEQQRQELLRKAQEQAEAERKRILAEAERAVQRRQDDGREALRREREESLRSARSEVVRQAVELSERLLRESTGAGLQGQLAQRLAESLDALPGPERERLRAEWSPPDGALLETAGALENGALGRLRSAVEGLLGRPVELSVQERPDLLAGARLRLGGHVWDASLAGQLEEVRPAAEEVTSGV